jgi:hypothetical protein
MRLETSGVGVALVLALGLSGCGGSNVPTTPLAPSPQPPQANVSGPPGYTLTGVSLSGVVYESTATGRAPIARAVVYCEPCGEQTHTFAYADDNGFYHFSGDLGIGGGVWVRPGEPTPLAVGYYNLDYQDPPGLPPSRNGSGWREVLIDGDTRFDIELVRRATATP